MCVCCLQVRTGSPVQLLACLLQILCISIWDKIHQPGLHQNGCVGLGPPGTHPGGTGARGGFTSRHLEARPWNRPYIHIRIVADRGGPDGVMCCAYLCTCVFVSVGAGRCHTRSKEATRNSTNDSARLRACIRAHVHASLHTHLPARLCARMCTLSMCMLLRKCAQI